VKQGGWYSTVSIAYYDGLKYPHLERIPGTTDMLTQIMTPKTWTPPKESKSKGG
jgi:hypothetical protein